MHPVLGIVWQTASELWSRRGEKYSVCVLACWIHVLIIVFEWVWCWWGFSRRLDVIGPDPPGQWNHAITSNSSWMFVITDLTPEEQQLLETIRERKQKLLKEIQVGLYIASVFLFLILLLNMCKLWSLLFCFYFLLCLTYQSHG